MITRVTFRLAGLDGRTSAAVTRRTGIRPTRSFEAADPVSRRSGRARGYSLWLLSSSTAIEDGSELAGQLHRVLDFLEPATAQLWELVGAGYDANWLGYVASHATEHAAELDRRTLQRLLALPGDLWLDVCGDGTDSA
ncbi:MAG TPA: DUF4279 domain-containing protein [Streptosporangiaceae bacterium]